MTVVRYITLLIVMLSFHSITNAAQLAIVIDDFGYRKHNEEQILTLPKEISIAILPDAPLSRIMAEKAFKQGRDILIHMPMAPISQQPLEKSTLHSNMNQQQIELLIKKAMNKLPEARGMNNHMGSAMTSNRAAMRHVFVILEQYQFYFLDSQTTSKSEVENAIEDLSVPLLKRHLFLDNDLDEKIIHQQFQKAIALARKQGNVIIIGHPHSQTLSVLKKELTRLPQDIQLTSISQLIPSFQAMTKKNEELPFSSEVHQFLITLLGKTKTLFPLPSKWYSFVKFLLLS